MQDISLGTKHYVTMIKPNSLSEILFPTRCFGCRALGPDICAKCRLLWSPHLYRSTLDSMHVYSAVLYSPVAKRIILSAKENGIKAADDLIIYALTHSLKLLLRDFEIGIHLGKVQTEREEEISYLRSLIQLLTANHWIVWIY